MTQHPMTIEGLHRYVDYLASRDTLSSDFIGPHANTSRFLGHAACLPEGFLVETMLPIMVRCVYPPNTQSRHAVIHITLSTKPEALAAKLYEMFDLKLLKGILVDTVTQTAYDDKMADAETFERALELLGTIKCGILGLRVISEEQFAVCPSYNHQANPDTATLQRVRSRFIDVRRLCVGCLVRLGFGSDGDKRIPIYPLRG